MDTSILKEAGLTEGEAKVYLTMLEIGSSTTGPIIEKSKIAKSIIYHILERLIEKGLASYIVKEKTKYFQAADPKKIIEYMEERKNKIEDSQKKVDKLLPQLELLQKMGDKTSVKIYEGFKGLQTCFEKYHTRLKKGDEVLSYGVYAVQEEKYHLYWQRDHVRRDKEGIINKLLFNKDTAKEILENRNSYKLCDARYMESDVVTPSWFMVYADTSIIFLQSKNPLAVEIINQEIADSFKAYFEDYWNKSKPFK